MRKINLLNEKNFENKKIANCNTRKNQEKFYNIFQPIYDDFDRLIKKRSFNKSVLEIGCSQGNNAFKLFRKTKNYVGVDISDLAILSANKRKNINKLSHFKFINMDVHSMNFENESFDIIYANAVLHHLDLELFLNEAYRILKKGGILIFNEPLGTNFIFNLYRRFTPNSRTSDEFPFDNKELKLVNKIFPYNSSYYYGFFSIICAYLNFNFIKSLTFNLDSLLSKTFLRRYFWYIFFLGEKK